MEVLSAFVRERSHEQWPLPELGGAQPERSMRPDVQAAVTVIGRRQASRDNQQLNLVGSNLSGAIFRGGNFAGATFYRTNLTRAVLFRTDLTKAVLADANLTSVILTNANQTRAALMRATMRSANMIGRT